MKKWLIGLLILSVLVFNIGGCGRVGDTCETNDDCQDANFCCANGQSTDYNTCVDSMEALSDLSCVSNIEGEIPPVPGCDPACSACQTCSLSFSGYVCLDNCPSGSVCENGVCVAATDCDLYGINC